MTLKKKILAIVLAVVIVVVGSAGVYAYSILNGISGDQLNEDTLSINNLLNSDVINIAVFGIDGRDNVEGNRSDTIMIVSLNYKTGEVKVTSVMRDTYARIPASENYDETFTKINAAYAYGGEQLAVQTLNENFDLNIRDYVVVNFDCLVDAVDTLGGIDVNIENEDVLKWTNLYIDDNNRITGKNDPHLTQTGTNHLTGVQALAYCRIRYSDDDYHRTARQREVIQQVFNKAVNSDMLTMINLLSQIYPYVQTSLSLNEMNTYLKAFLSLDSKTMTDSRVPYDEYLTGMTIGGADCIVPNTLVDNVTQLHKFIYGDDTQYTPSSTVIEISNEIVDRSGVGSYYSTDQTTTDQTTTDQTTTDQTATDQTTTDQTTTTGY